MNGMGTRHFDLIMGCLPLILQAALLLNYALYSYLFIEKVVASVLVRFTSSNLLFYLLISPAPFPTTTRSKRPLPSSSFAS